VCSTIHLIPYNLLELLVRATLDRHVMPPVYFAESLELTVGGQDRQQAVSSTTFLHKSQVNAMHWVVWKY